MSFEIAGGGVRSFAVLILADESPNDFAGWTGVLVFGAAIAGAGTRDLRVRRSRGQFLTTAYQRELSEEIMMGEFV